MPTLTLVFKITKCLQNHREFRYPHTQIPLCNSLRAHTHTHTHTHTLSLTHKSNSLTFPAHPMLHWGWWWLHDKSLSPCCTHTASVVYPRETQSAWIGPHSVANEKEKFFKKIFFPRNGSKHIWCVKHNLPSTFKSHVWTFLLINSLGDW